MLAYCGLRWSEAIGMHLRDINFTRHCIQANRAAVDVEGRIVVGSPKNWERRVVPFPEFLDEAPKALCQDKSADDAVFVDVDVDGITFVERRPVSELRPGSARRFRTLVSNG